MKLSEAIRLGAMALPEVHGPIFARDSGGGICGACAIGAAIYAIGATAHVRGDYCDDVAAVESILPILSQWIDHPVTGRRNDVWGIVVSLFEDHGRSREQIADWVATVEAQQDAALFPQPVPVEAAP